MSHRVRCTCGAAFSPDVRLVHGVMRTACRSCRAVIVIARADPILVQVTVTATDADTLRTVADVVRWASRIRAQSA